MRRSQWHRVKHAVSDQVASWSLVRWLGTLLPRMDLGTLTPFIRSHRLSVLAISILIIATVVYFVADPSDFDQRLKTLTAIGTGVGALALFFNLMFTSETVENSRKALEHQKLSQQETLRHQQKSQQDDRFFKAAELLSNEKSIDARIGALYALERLANESEDYYHQVIEVICTFIRRRSEETNPTEEQAASLEPENLPTAPHDIDVAVRILGRRTHRFGDGEQQYMDLRDANFCGLYIPDADFTGAVLSRSFFINTHFLRGSMAGANLRRVDFRYATFEEVLLSGAAFVGSAGENAELIYDDVLADPRPRIPRDVGNDEDRHWVRESVPDAKDVNGIDYLHGTVWSDDKFHGARLKIFPPFLRENLKLEPDLLWHFTLNTDDLPGKDLPMRMMERQSADPSSAAGEPA